MLCSGNHNADIYILQAEAPPDVVSMISESQTNGIVPPSPPDSGLDQVDQPVSAKERAGLLMIQELIKRRLEVSTKTTSLG